MIFSRQYLFFSSWNKEKEFEIDDVQCVTFTPFLNLDSRCKLAPAKIRAVIFSFMEISQGQVFRLFSANEFPDYSGIFVNSP